VAESGGELVGVAAGAVFGGTGWVGGVAVVPAARRVGLGGALTEAIVEFLEGRGVATVLLHATALGRPVYERLGFVPETAYLTLSGPTRPRPPDGPPLRPGRPGDLEAVLALDLVATGDGRPLGYHLASPWRPGGAAVAADQEAGLTLLDAVRDVPGDEVAISVPAANPAAVRYLEAAGFSERYRTVRMHRGPRVSWDPAALFGAYNLFWG
jgi:GNAT superfamily N-acetyltransferase